MTRVADLLSEHPEGWLDDSGAGRGQVDMYTVDAYLFAEPLSERLGEVWERGLRSAARLVDAVADPDGSALTWGRSIGALAVCHTAELAALLLRRGEAADPTRWLHLARTAADRAPDWFTDGLINAHAHRAVDAYRGPFRRLQMTLDCAGKLVSAALDLRAAASNSVLWHDDRHTAGSRAKERGLGDERDEWLSFGEGAGVWARREPRLGLVLPVVGGPGASYAPAPRRNGRFEVPVDSPLACFVPHRLARRASLRTRRSRQRGRVTSQACSAYGMKASRRPAAALLGEEAERLDAQRAASYEVRGRTLVVDEDLSFAEPPGALAVLVPETPGQPLHVAADCAVTTVDVDGLAEWRSATGELSTVHQIEPAPAERVRFRWSVTVKLRVLSTARHHWYHECQYGPLADRVAADRPFPYHLLDSPDRLARELADVDVLHLHWPEWLTGLDPARNERIVRTLSDIGVPVVWTQHNLAPHAAPDEVALYQTWAGLAAGVIHHSNWGQAAITERYRFRPDARHAVIPHGHWGPLMDGFEQIDRSAAEAELGLEPCALRIGLVGAPRPGKDTQLLLDGFAASTRPDVQLLVLSLSDEDVPDDPRITALPYEEVPRDQYDRRLATIDVLALPLEGGTYLTTGQVADAVGAGIPALTSSWPYLAEVLGDAAIPYGRTAADLAATIDGLDDGTPPMLRRLLRGSPRSPRSRHTPSVRRCCRSVG